MSIDFKPRPSSPPFPPPLKAAAFHGVVGEAVRLIAPRSEADPAVLLIRLLSACGCIVDRGPHIDIDGIDHPARLWPVIVGCTGSGRKGQSWGSIRRLLKLADSKFCNEQVASGLTTGQGLVHAVRDPLRGIPPKKPTPKQQAEMDANDDGLCVLDPGVLDKRLPVREPELAKVIAATNRDGDNLSATLRDARDGNPIREMTRSNLYGSTGHHVVIQADVTPTELRAILTATDKANGFANRFLFVASRRSKSLPFGGSLTDDDLLPMAERLAKVLATARDIGAMTWTADARPIWAEVYERMNTDADVHEVGGESPLSMLLARGPTHVLRLSIAFAVLDGTDAIAAEHIAAAEAVWRYVADSTAWAFGEAIAEADPLDVLQRWSINRNPSAAEVARSGPKPWKGNTKGVAKAFAQLAEQGRGTWAYGSTSTKGTMRYTPKDDPNVSGRDGYTFPPDTPVDAETVFVSTALGLALDTDIAGGHDPPAIERPESPPTEQSTDPIRRKRAELLRMARSSGWPRVEFMRGNTIGGDRHTWRMFATHPSHRPSHLLRAQEALREHVPDTTAA